MICPRHGEWRALWNDECPMCRNAWFSMMADTVALAPLRQFISGYPHEACGDYDLAAEIARANAAHLRAIMAQREQSVGFTIPVSVREIDESTSGWPFRKEPA